GCLSQPEWNRRRLTMSVFNSNFTLLDSHHAPGSVPELEDVPLQTLNREIFINATDNQAAGFKHDRIVGRVGNGAAGSYRRQTSAATPSQSLIYRIMMKVGRATTALCGKAISQHAHYLIKIS